MTIKVMVFQMSFVERTALRQQWTFFETLFAFPLRDSDKAFLSVVFKIIFSLVIYVIIKALILMFYLLYTADTCGFTNSRVL